jgi:hypothetical protein
MQMNQHYTELRNKKNYSKPLTTRKETGALVKDSKAIKKFIKIDYLLFFMKLNGISNLKDRSNLRNSSK